MDVRCVHAAWAAGRVAASLGLGVLSACASSTRVPAALSAPWLPPLPQASHDHPAPLVLPGPPLFTSHILLDLSAHIEHHGMQGPVDAS